jgi:hypothetical protein
MHDPLAQRAQSCCFGVQAVILGPGRSDRTSHCSCWRQAREFTQIHGKSGCRTSTSKNAAKIVVPPPQRHCRRTAYAISGKRNPAVIVITTKVSQIKAQGEISQRICQAPQVGERTDNLRQFRQKLGGLVENTPVAVQLRQGQQR